MGDFNASVRKNYDGIGKIDNEVGNNKEVHCWEEQNQKTRAAEEWWRVSSGTLSGKAPG